MESLNQDLQKRVNKFDNRKKSKFSPRSKVKRKMSPSNIKIDLSGASTIDSSSNQKLIQLEVENETLKAQVEFKEKLLSTTT